MKHKAGELTGALLDAAVGAALGAKQQVRGGKLVYVTVGLPFQTSADGDETFGDSFEPSRLWAHGGPIIERERIEWVVYSRDGAIGAHHQWEARLGDGRFASGPTPLIAAMRAYVGSKLGEEVELP